MRKGGKLVSKIIRGLFKKMAATVGIFSLVITAIPLNLGGTRVKAAYELSDGVKYLSDMNYISGFAKDNKLYKDRNANNQTIQLVMRSTEDDKGNITNQEIKSFIKGVGAWATSELVYEIPEGFQNFESYIGVDARRQETYYNGGVTFRIYLSNDKDSWGEEKYNSGTLKGMNVAKQVNIVVNGFKYIKLVADENGNSFYSSWYDDAVYADAKFTKDGYSGEGISLSGSSIKTVKEYDDIIKTYITKSGDDYMVSELDDLKELTILRREYVSRIGYDILSSYYTLSTTYRDTINWLMDNITNLKYYLDVNLGSSENYAKSLTILADLYREYETDFTNADFTEADRDLYKRMAIALSCSHVNGVRFWATGGESNGSEAIARYDIFKDLHIKGRLNSALFDTASIPEMRIIMGNQISDDQIEWLNWYASSDKGRVENPESYSSPNLAHGSYIRYNSHLNWNYNNPVYFSQGKVLQTIDDEYSLTKHRVNITDSKLWAVMKEGAVCGGQSKTGANLRGVYGYPSFVIGQPGHAAYFHQIDDTTGGKKWTIGNNIYGWWKSEYGGNMLGWTGSYNGIRWAGATGPDNKYYTGSYLVLEQAAVNDIANLRKSQDYIYMAGIVDNLDQKEVLYEKAVSTLSINVKGWLGLIDVYNKKNKSDEKFLELSQRIASALKYYPLPMNDMLTLIKNNYIKGALEKTNLDTLRIDTLNEAVNISNSETLQPEVTKTIAENLINATRVEMATFSLDGPNAGKIIFDKSYSTAASATFLYSLTGVETDEEGRSTTKWIESTTGDTIQLTPTQIDSLKEELGIIVKLMGQPDSMAFSIPLIRAEKPEGIVANDNDDVVVGATGTMEWSIYDDVSAEWTVWKRFGDELPDLSGNVTVRVRNGATGHTLVGLEYEELTFTESKDPKERKYVSVTNIEVSSSTNNNGSTTEVNVLDGNEKTYWSSTQRFTDSYRRLIFTFKEEKFITAVEILPRQDSSAGRPNEIRIAITDAEGTIIKTLKTEGDIDENSKEKIVINLDNPVKVKNITVSGTSDVKDFICISMVSFYEDKTKNIETDAPGFEPDEEEVFVLEEHMVFAEDAKVKITTGEDGKKYVTAEGFKNSKIDVLYYTTGESGVLSYDCYAIFTRGEEKINSGPVEDGMIMNVYDISGELRYRYIVVMPDEEEDYIHEHKVIESWISDKDNHWKACNNGCGEKLYLESHTAGERVNVLNPTETEKGYTGDVYCSICNRIIEKGEDIEPLTPLHQHSYSETWIGDDTYHWKACNGCDEVIEYGAHNKILKDEIEATTTQNGYTGDVYCTICGQLIESGREIDKLGGSGEEEPDKEEESPSTPESPPSNVNPVFPVFPVTPAPVVPLRVEIAGDSTESVGITVNNGVAEIGKITEDALKKIAGNSSSGKEEFTLDLTKIETIVDKVSLDKETFQLIAKVIKDADNSKERLEIICSNETLSLDEKAISTIAKEAKGSEVEISLNVNIGGNVQGILNAAQTKTKDEMDSSNERSVVGIMNLVVTSAGQIISDFKGGNIWLSISSFRPEQGKNAQNYHVYFLTKEGVAKRMATWVKNGIVYFQTGHFSEYIIVYDETLENGESLSVYRLYNPKNGDHIFTTNAKEKDFCIKAGWKDEGVAFYSIPSKDKIMYRVYNKKTGEHFYTSSKYERNMCIDAGWKDEGVAFSGEAVTSVYRLYNKGYKHMYTSSNAEKDNLVGLGWNYEGIVVVGN